MTSNFEESSDEIGKGKFKHQIDLVKENKISWEDLASILDVLTPTFSSLKQLIEILLEELKIALRYQGQKSIDFQNKGREVTTIKHVLEDGNEYGIDSVSDDEIRIIEEKSKPEKVQIISENELSIKGGTENASVRNESGFAQNEIPDFNAQVEDNVENESSNQEIVDQIPELDDPIVDMLIANDKSIEKDKVVGGLRVENAMNSKRGEESQTTGKPFETAIKKSNNSFN